MMQIDFDRLLLLGKYEEQVSALSLEQKFLDLTEDFLKARVSECIRLIFIGCPSMANTGFQGSIRNKQSIQNLV